MRDDVRWSSVSRSRRHTTYRAMAKEEEKKKKVVEKVVEKKAIEKKVVEKKAVERKAVEAKAAENGSLEELAAKRKAEQEQKQRQRLERKAARLAKKIGGDWQSAKATLPRGNASEAAATGGGKLLTKAQLRKARKAAKKAEPKKKLSQHERMRKAAAAQKLEEGPKSEPVAAWVPGPKKEIKKKYVLEKQINHGYLQKSNRQARGPALASGKMSKAELSALAGETVEPVLQSKLPVGFVLGWTRTNGGFGSKADTIAKTAGKASGSR